MEALVINQAEVRRLLPMDECIEVMQEALLTLAAGDGVQPLRMASWLPDRRGLIGVMPAYLGGKVSAPGVKIVTVFPGNHGGPLDAHQGAVLLFDGENGSLRAVMDGTEVTSVRTAAVSGVATRALAREDARQLAILGSGVQAWTHLAAMQTVRPIERVRVWSRTRANAEGFAARASKRFGLPVEAVSFGREAVAGADIICVATSASEPVLDGAWLPDGVHINAVGACTPKVRELDTSTVVLSRLFVDRRESTLAEAGDFLIAREEGAVGDEHILAELGEVLAGRHPGRGSDEERTLFKSVGIGVEDVAAAHHIYDKARAQGLGTTLEFGGERVDAD